MKKLILNSVLSLALMTSPITYANNQTEESFLQRNFGIEDLARDFGYRSAATLQRAFEDARAAFETLSPHEAQEKFEELVKQTQEITGDILITSPNDFNGLNDFLKKNSQSTKY